jgi:organic hydroperoxide reductase OsmC/OhrA
MAKEHRYAASLIWTGGAKGPLRDYAGYSREYTFEIPGKPSLIGSADLLFKGDPTLHNPEDLLVAALSACHMLTYLAECARAKIEVRSYGDEASGVMVLSGGGGCFTEVTLRPRVVVAPGCDLAKARALHKDAHAQCFIANSVNFPVVNEPQVSEAGPAA